MREEEAVGAFFLEDGGEGQFVGIFRGELPAWDGVQRFEVWRCGGNYNMAIALGAGLSPRCFYLRPDGTRQYFTAHDAPDYGTLRLSLFSDRA